MLFENTNNKTGNTTAIPVNNLRQQAMARPVQSMSPKNGTTAAGPATKPKAPVTGWPSAAKQSPRQITGRPVTSAGRPLQNTGFVPGKTTAVTKPFTAAATAGVFKQQVQAPVTRKQTNQAYINPVKRAGGYQRTNQQVTGWGSKRSTTAPMQTAAVKKSAYRYNPANAAVATAGVVNRGNYYQRNSAVNPRTYYNQNNRPPFYNAPVMVPTQPGSTAWPTRQNIFRQPAVYPQAPCSCKCGNSNTSATPPAPKQPSYFPENPGNYGSYPTQQIPAPPIKPTTGICHSCQKTGKGCNTIARFAFNSFQLKKRHKAQLKELAMLILSKKINTVIATGHTDSSGTEDYNQELGAKRAATVISELRKELALLKPNAQRALLWRTDSKGETQPVAANNAANNRRVEICLRRTRI